VLSYKVASPCQISLGGGEGVFMALLSGSSCRHFNLISEGYSFDRMLFLQYSFGFYRFSSFSIPLFFIDQSTPIVDNGLCIVESCRPRWKRLIRFPM
jgi:hypothetical protein